MTTPHYINEIMSDLRCVKTGWYAIDDEGDLSSGPFSSREECITRIAQPTRRLDVISIVSKAELNRTPPTSSQAADGARRSDQRPPLKRNKS